MDPVDVCRYRPAKPLPAQLLDHCTVCFEEQLYIQSFSLLSNALSAGTGSLRPAHVAPPQHLALAATLAVHPSFNTRTTSKDKLEASDHALLYLKQANQLVGPCNAAFDQAFRFVDKSGVVSRGKRARTRQFDSVSADADADADRPEQIRSKFVHQDALWSNADDFWCVVGWAFNCSVAHKRRWERWRTWLEFMLDVLADDLEARDRGTAGDTSDTEADRNLDEALLAQYLLPIGQGRNNKRRVMRAILADGSPKSLAEFGEIWKNETRPPKRKKDARGSKRRKLDLDAGEFGDYFDDDSADDDDDGDDDSPDGSRARRSRSTPAAPGAAISHPTPDHEPDPSAGERSPKPAHAPSPPPPPALGGIQAVHLRQRCLALLVRLGARAPRLFLDPEDLLDLYTEFLRPLPLAGFRAFVLPTRRYLDPHTQASLDQTLLRPLLAAAAPAYDANALTQRDFVAHYAPFPAHGVGAVDNAKVSLLLEDLLRLLWTTGGLVGGARLRRAVEQGIAARRAKAAGDGRRRAGGQARDEEAAAVMAGSADRMLACLDMVRATEEPAEVV